MSRKQSQDDDDFLNAIALMLEKENERRFPNSNQEQTEAPQGVNAEDQSGWTPLFISVAENNSELATDLIRQGANVNHQCSSNGWTALTNAAYWGHSESVILLLAHGADPLLKSEDGLTAIEIAVRMHRRNVLRIFKKYFELKNLS